MLVNSSNLIKIIFSKPLNDYDIAKKHLLPLTFDLIAQSIAITTNCLFVTFRDASKMFLERSITILSRFWLVLAKKYGKQQNIVPIRFVFPSLFRVYQNAEGNTSFSITCFFRWKKCFFFFVPKKSHV